MLNLPPQRCREIAKGLILGLVSVGVSPTDRERILKIALRGAQALNARIQRRKKTNGAKHLD